MRTHPLPLLSGRRDPPARMAGSSLIEVLVSLFLVAITMLGLMGLMLNTVARQKDSIDRRTAAMIASDLAERIAANPAGFEAGGYDKLSFVAGGTAPTRPTCSGTCTPEQVAQTDWADIVAAVGRRLPGGAVWSDTGDDGRWAWITVGWTDPRRESDFHAVEVTRDKRCERRNASIAKDYRCYELRTLP